jgi:copper chaperone
MIRLNIPDMTCSHCAGVITKAVESVDANAIVSVDYGTKIVSIETTAVPSTISKAVDAAGYQNQAA